MPSRLKLKNIFSKSFLVGFEVECIIDAEKYSLDKLEEDLYKIHPDIVTDDDASLEGDGKFEYEETVEIKTPPLTPAKSLGVLKRVFKLVEKYGYTNETCGLHASFSPVKDSDYYACNPFYIMNHKLFEKILSDFQRENNVYCNRFEMPEFQSPLAVWQNLMQNGSDNRNDLIYKLEDYYGHESAVNFDNYHKNRHKDSRIEIRAMGNTNYHRKFDKVADYTGQIIEVIKQSFRQKNVLVKN